MPILSKEVDVFPEDLLYRDGGSDSGSRWHVLFTKSRFDKVLARHLCQLGKKFCCLQIPTRSRMPSGKMKTSYLPLFPNYVFLYGDDQDRYDAVCTNCVRQVLEVDDGQQLQGDLRRIHTAIQTGHRVSAVQRLEKGQPVKIVSGPLSGQQGMVFRQHGKSRLVLTMRFIHQGAEVEVDDSVIEPL